MSAPLSSKSRSVLRSIGRRQHWRGCAVFVILSSSGGLEWSSIPEVVFTSADKIRGRAEVFKCPGPVSTRRYLFGVGRAVRRTKNSSSTGPGKWSRGRVTFDDVIDRFGLVILRLGPRFLPDFCPRSFLPPRRIRNFYPIVTGALPEFYPIFTRCCIRGVWLFLVFF